MKFQSTPPSPDDWETLSSELHYESPHLSVSTVEVQSPAGRRARRWTIAHRKAAVIVAPITQEGKLVLIRQERIPIQREVWEVPGGQVDDPGMQDVSALEAVGLRELAEETGYELAPGGSMTELGDFFSSPGFTDEHSYFFLARPVARGAAGPAHTESETILDCREFAGEEIAEMIRRNEICDANTLGMWAKLVARGYLSLGQ